MKDDAADLNSWIVVSINSGLWFDEKERFCVRRKLVYVQLFAA